MMETYYFDTSIWLDFFECRNEQHLQKGDLAHQLLNKIVHDNAKIVYSDHVLFELKTLGYASFEIELMFNPLRPILLFVEATRKQIGKAKDLALKRGIPKGDALHALIARDNNAIMVTLDRHFKELIDIVEPKRPDELM